MPISITDDDMLFFTRMKTPPLYTYALLSINTKICRKTCEFVIGWSGLNVVLWLKSSESPLKQLKLEGQHTCYQSYNSL